MVIIPQVYIQAAFLAIGDCVVVLILELSDPVLVVFQEQSYMVPTVKPHLLHGSEFLILDHLSPLDFATYVVEVGHFKFVGHPFLVLLSVQYSCEYLEFIDGLE